jgi:serine/threonine protein kinase/tetratricopeptide (TPR) repeat protein
MDEQSIFIEALEKADPGERAAFLDQACGADSAIRHRIDRLLQRHQQPGSFLESLAADLPLSLWGEGDGIKGVQTEGEAATIDEPMTEQSGTVIGPYKLLEQIGEGGFGVVFMAEQQHPIRRKVALKIIKPGMDTRQVIARFEAERQALALMDHPHIAQIHDGGTTADGRPFFVMELVRGLSITDYCDQNCLAMRERLELFLHVCQAVQHAHQKGIIHRDIKPTNVLVTQHDGTPVPKIIDFGIAKALGQQLTDKTVFTNFAHLVGTPLYMSPEQAALSNQDVDTRSDIYSLGVLLYELLTGTTPFDKNRLKTAGYDEMRRIIREEEPPKPSTRISSLLRSATTVSTQRKSDGKRLSQLFRGELDWIVMKCLEKDRNRRYETANGLARDIQRYLHDEPVLACPPSRLYRVRKFARRHTMGFAVASLLAALLIASVLILAISNVRIAQEKKQKEEAANTANRQQERAEENLRLALQALDEIYLQLAEDSLPRDPQRKKEDTELLRKALDFYQQFARQNTAAPAVRLEVCRAYRRVGDIQEFVGEHVLAERAYREATACAQELATTLPKEPVNTWQLAICHNRLGESLRRAGAVSPAKEHFEQAIDLLTPVTADHSVRAEYREELAHSYYGFAELMKQKGDRSAGEQSYQQALAIQSKLAADFPTVARYRLDQADMYRGLGNWVEGGHAFSMTPEGHEHVRTACRLLNDLVAEFPNVTLYRYRLAAALAQLSNQAGPPDEKFKGFQRAIDLFTKLADEFPQVPQYRSDLGSCYCNFGEWFRMSGNWDKAAECWRKSLDLSMKLADEYPGQSHYTERLAVDLCNWAEMSVYQGDFAQARKCAEDSLIHARHFRKSYPNNVYFAGLLVEVTYLLASTVEALDDHAEAVKKTKEAEHDLAEACAQLSKDRSPSIAAGFCGDVATELQYIGQAWEKTGKQKEAAINHRARANVYSEVITLTPENGRAYAERGHIYFGLKDWSKAAADYSEAIARQASDALVWHRRAHAYENLGEYERALADFAKAIELSPQNPGFRHCRGQAYARRKEWEKAATEFSKVIELKPDWPEPWKERADAYAHLGQGEKSAADYEKFFTFRPGNAKSYNDLAWSLATASDLQLRNPEYAVQLAGKAVQLAPKEGFFWNTLGAAHYRVGHWKDAIEALTKSMELLNGQMESFNAIFLAMAHWQLDEKEKARNWYDRAVLWLEKNKDQWEGNKQLAEELRRFRAEAAELLGIKDEKLNHQDTKDTKVKP